MLRYRQRMASAMTPEERMKRSAEIQRAAFASLASNPEALHAFHARNHHKRRQSVVLRLEIKLKKGRDRVTDNESVDE